MKCLKLAITFVSLVAFGRCLSPIPDPVDGTIHLLAQDSPFVLEEDLLIAEGETLQIDAGVTVHVAPGKQVLVFGNFLVNAPAETPVVFTVDVTSELYDAENATSWAGIVVFRNETDFEVSGLVLRNAGERNNGTEWFVEPALWVEGAKHVTLR